MRNLGGDCGLRKGPCVSWEALGWGGWVEG